MSNAGNPELARGYLSTLENLNTAIERHAEAFERGHDDLDAVQAAQDDAEEESRPGGS